MDDLWMIYGLGLFMDELWMNYLIKMTMATMAASNPPRRWTPRALGAPLASGSGSGMSHERGKW